MPPGIFLTEGEVMVTKGRIILNEEKRIAGKDHKAGTVLATVECDKDFTIQDVDLAMQLAQSKLVYDEEPKKEVSKKK